MAKRSDPKPGGSNGPRRGGKGPSLRRAMAELDEPFGQTMIVECSEVSPFPDLDDEVEFDESHPLSAFADDAIDLVVDVIRQWYDPPLGEGFDYNRSLWTTSDDRASGQAILFEIDLDAEGYYLAVVAPPGTDPDDATTMVWIGRELDDEA